MITEIEDYFAKGCGRCARFDTPACSTKLWAEGIAELRRICLGAGLGEEVKWGHPCYVQNGRNIAIIGAFLGDFRLTFFSSALMTDPEGILERAGPNTRHAGVVRFTQNDGPKTLEPVLTRYLAEAMDYAAKGILPPKEQHDLDLPPDLTDALDADPELSDAFRALTPGRQRSYVINLNGAKQRETRLARIAKFRAKIIAGKGATER